MKKSGLIKAVVVLALLACCQISQALVARTPKLTMVVVPARFSVLQVSFDLINRFSAVLVSYQGDATTDVPLIHAWNGQEWVAVALDDYREASFLQVTPLRTIIVGDESMVPAVLTEAGSWCQEVVNIPSIDTATMVNSFGRLFDFSRSDWQWFSKRYNLGLQDMNSEKRKRSWYDFPFVEKKTEQPEEVQPAEPAPEVQPPVADDLPPSTEVLPPTDAQPEQPAVEPQTATPESQPAAEPTPRIMAAPTTPAAEPQAPEGWQEKAVAIEPPPL